MRFLTSGLIFILFISFTPLAEARHGDSVNRSKLDNDIVEEFPVPILFGVAYESIVPDFGDPRGGGTRSHEGQDMRAPKGTPIVSPTEAIVISTGEGASAGKYVYTANPGGETFRYMHLDEIANGLRRGDVLDVGDFIGTVGDTGNAPDGVYHLHFEVRDSKNRATDPYERLAGDVFSLKEKMSFMRDIMNGVDDEDEYAEFLVETFKTEFLAAYEKKYDLPNEIEDVLGDSDVVAAVDLLVKLRTIIATIPALLPVGMTDGDSGTHVALLQTYIIFNSEGPARDYLAASGATGYFGGITTAALIEFQEDNNISETGVFDTATKREMAQS